MQTLVTAYMIISPCKLNFLISTTSLMINKIFRSALDAPNHGTFRWYVFIIITLKYNVFHKNSLYS